MVVLILAAGTNARWGAWPIPKEVLPLPPADEPLVVHTLRLAAECELTPLPPPLLASTQPRSRHHTPRPPYASLPVLVTHKRQVYAAVHASLYPFRWFPARHRRWTVETLLSTRAYWGEGGRGAVRGAVRGTAKDDRVVVLLGDVFYTHAAMRRIAACAAALSPAGFQMLGTRYEVFSLCFAAPYDAVIAAANAALTQAKRGGLGKLRQLYRAYYGIGLDDDEMADYIPIEDGTRDFDFVEQYDEFIHARGYA